MQYPDEDLPTSQLSLEEFVKISQHLHSLSSSHPDAFIRFNLAGRFLSNALQSHITVNIRQGNSLIGKTIYRRSDIDSVIGVSADLPFIVPLAIFPLASFRDTLTEDNHLKYKPHKKSPQINSPAAGVPFFKIPNMAFGKIDRRQITRIFFPWSYAEGESSAIDTEMRTYIYERCIRVAILHVDPFNQSRWPITYKEAMKLYRDEKGLFHCGTIDLAPRFLPQFSAKLLDLFQQHDALKDAFFLHEMRGLKGGTNYDDVADSSARCQAIKSAFHGFNFSQVAEDDWFVDVGTEFWCENHVLQWLTIAHQEVLKVALPSASPEQILSVINSKQQMKVDLSAQLRGIGGFRSEPGSRGVADGVSYINAYTSDKAATYQLHNGIFKRRKGWHVFPGRVEKFLKNLERIAETFETCAGDEPFSALESNARMEVRVSLPNAYHALLQFPDETAQNTIIAIDPKVFWLFKYYRISALMRVVKGLARASPERRLANSSLALGALITYQVNALIYRPEDGRAETALLEAACQHAVDSQTSITYPTMYERGVYFVSDIIFEAGNATGIPSIRSINESHLLILYSRSLMADIEIELYDDSGKWASLVANRRQKRRRLIGGKEDEEEEDEEEDGGGDGNQVSQLDLHDLGQSGTRHLESRAIRRALEISLMDLEEDEHQMRPGSITTVLDDHPEDELTYRIREIRGLSDILSRFASDVLQLAPRAKDTDVQWLVIDPTVEARKIKIEVFRTLSLSHVFEQAMCKRFDSVDWRLMIFDRYFPKKGFEPPSSFSHYRSALYWHLWMKLLDGLDEEGAKDCRDLTFSWFRTLAWVPFPQTDRMWTTKTPTGKGWSKLPATGTLTIMPSIAINADTWVQ